MLTPIARVLLAVSLLSLAACGNGEEPASPSTTSVPLPTTIDSSEPPPPPPPSVPAEDPIDPCALLAFEEVVSVLGFVAREQLTPARTDGERTLVCTWAHDTARHQGGFALVEVVTSEQLEVRRESIEQPEELPDLGEGAVLGRLDGGYGAGANAILVDLGDGGLQVFVSVYQTLERDDLLWLGELAVARWELLQQADDVGPTATTTTTRGPDAAAS